MNDRQTCLHWWKSILDKDKQQLSNFYYKRNWESLTGSEIEKLYNHRYLKKNIAKLIKPKYLKWKEENPDKTIFYYGGFTFVESDFI